MRDLVSHYFSTMKGHVMNKYISVAKVDKQDNNKELKILYIILKAKV